MGSIGDGFAGSSTTTFGNDMAKQKRWRHCICGDIILDIECWGDSSILAGEGMGRELA